MESEYSVNKWCCTQTNRQRKHSLLFSFFTHTYNFLILIFWANLQMWNIGNTKIMNQAWSKVETFMKPLFDALDDFDMGSGQCPLALQTFRDILYQTCKVSRELAPLSSTLQHLHNSFYASIDALCQKPSEQPDAKPEQQRYTRHMVCEFRTQLAYHLCEYEASKTHQAMVQVCRTMEMVQLIASFLFPPTICQRYFYKPSKKNKKKESNQSYRISNVFNSLHMYCQIDCLNVLPWLAKFHKAFDAFAKFDTPHPIELSGFVRNPFLLYYMWKCKIKLLRRQTGLFPHNKQENHQLDIEQEFLNQYQQRNEYYQMSMAHYDHAIVINLKTKSFQVLEKNKLVHYYKVSEDEYNGKHIATKHYGYFQEYVIDEDEGFGYNVISDKENTMPKHYSQSWHDDFDNDWNYGGDDDSPEAKQKRQEECMEHHSYIPKTNLLYCWVTE
jgi:hypothetical protein